MMIDFLLFTNSLDLIIVSEYDVDIVTLLKVIPAGTIGSLFTIGNVMTTGQLTHPIGFRSPHIELPTSNDLMLHTVDR